MGRCKRRKIEEECGGDGWILWWVMLEECVGIEGEVYKVRLRFIILLKYGSSY